LSAILFGTGVGRSGRKSAAVASSRCLAPVFSFGISLDGDPSFPARKVSMP
jgi:hypothetical protein